jgi:hypothetical protein
MSWVALTLTVIGSQYVQFLLRRPPLPFELKLVSLLAMHVLPVFAVVWLAAGSLFFGGEPGAGMRTRLTSFRATLPVGTGTLAAQRILRALLAWMAVWIPILLLSVWYDPEMSGMSSPDAHRQVLQMVAFWMAVSAHVLIGALPLFLWGRLEGFPNMLLSAIVSWTAAWLLAGIIWVDPTGTEKWTAPLIWFGLKLGISGWALVKSWRAGQITWRYAVGLVGGWLALVALLSFALPVWQYQGMRGVLAMALFMPLARLALCPLALAANRSR